MLVTHAKEGQARSGNRTEELPHLQPSSLGSVLPGRQLCPPELLGPLRGCWVLLKPFPFLSEPLGLGPASYIQTDPESARENGGPCGSGTRVSASSHRAGAPQAPAGSARPCGSWQSRSALLHRPHGSSGAANRTEANRRGSTATERETGRAVNTSGPQRCCPQGPFRPSARTPHPGGAQCSQPP